MRLKGNVMHTFFFNTFVDVEVISKTINLPLGTHFYTIVIAVVITVLSHNIFICGIYTIVLLQQ